MRRSLAPTLLLAAPLLLGACSQASDAIGGVVDSVQGAVDGVSTVQDACAQAESALKSGEPDNKISEAFAQPLAELKALLQGASLIPGLQSIINSLDSAQAALQAGTADTAQLGKQLADACQIVGK